MVGINPGIRYFFPFRNSMWECCRVPDLYNPPGSGIADGKDLQGIGVHVFFPGNDPQSGGQGQVF